MGWGCGLWLWLRMDGREGRATTRTGDGNQKGCGAERRITHRRSSSSSSSSTPAARAAGAPGWGRARKRPLAAARTAAAAKAGAESEGLPGHWQGRQEGRRQKTHVRGRRARGGLCDRVRPVGAKTKKRGRGGGRTMLTTRRPRPMFLVVQVAGEAGPLRWDRWQSKRGKWTAAGEGGEHKLVGQAAGAGGRAPPEGWSRRGGGAAVKGEGSQGGAS